MADERPVIISDLGGVIYSFDASFDDVAHAAAFEKMLESYATDPNFSDVLRKYREGDIFPALAAEREAVFGFFNDSPRRKLIGVYFNERAVMSLKELIPKSRVAVVATSLEETSKKILSEALRSEALVEELEICNMANFGSKKDPESWRKIFRRYNRIDAIIEDNSENLETALSAAQSLGFSPTGGRYFK